MQVLFLNSHAFVYNILHMTTFTYSAAQRNGTMVTGEREAENPKELAHALKEEGFLLLKAKEKGAGSLLHFSINIREIIARIKPISLVDKMFFSRNLAVMLSAGLPLTRALEASAEESQNPKFKTIMADISSSVIQGKSFADALRPHDAVFNELYVNMIEVGETSGKLSLVLKLLSNQMKKDHDLRSRVKGALMYPAVIVSALVGVGIVMMIYVIPSLTATIKELHVELPLSTRIIMFISDALVAHGILAGLGSITTIIILLRLAKSKTGRKVFDRISLRIPIFGSLIQKFNMARFSRTLSYLITSGIPIVKSLEITSKVLGNGKYKAAVLQASEEIQKGTQLHEILQGYPHLFHPMVIQMVKVGEESGKISNMLLRLALFFEEDVTNTTKNLSSIIEPILMVIIGAIVGFFAISMLQPIYGSLGNL